VNIATAKADFVYQRLSSVTEYGGRRQGAEEHVGVARGAGAGTGSAESQSGRSCRQATDADRPQGIRGSGERG
jgi:hypothetical protein